jgi:cellulose synthase/poly-beta-1,6-N-acetylglucosamine synthase-like glycosyltransferase
MPFISVIFDTLFLVSVSVVWTMILYQLVLAIFGYHYRRATESHETGEIPGTDLPPVSILIPARNEAVVIEQTLHRLLSLDYPVDKLEIIVINDGSTDKTKALLDQAALRDGRIKPLHLPAISQGRGKSFALNIGLKNASHDLIAVYDADNHPEPASLKKLVRHLAANDGLGAVIGKFRTLNRKTNLLTRFINIETLSFQWIVQAGRYRAFQIAILPGTNYVIRKKVLEQCGGWDENAITEDAELSVRLYQNRWRIGFVPYAVTWEDEPEHLKAWLRQRTRWVRGNNYVVRKFFREPRLLKNRFLALEFVNLFILYYFFLFAIVVSHLLFLLCGLGIVSVSVPGPYTAVWLSAFLMYLLEIVLVLSYENEDNSVNILATMLMYFTYCQLWIIVVFYGLFLDATRTRLGVWDKTERIEHKSEALPGREVP